MGKRLKSFADWRLQENLREYDFYFKKYQNLIMNLFKWENLPDGISARYIEEKLFYSGSVIFFKSKLGFYVVSKATPIGNNHYEEPIGYNAYGVDGINEYVKACDCVVIWNNIFREGSINTVNFYAKRQSNVRKTFDVNLEQMKNPYIISCSEGQRETVKQIMKDKSDGVPYIYVSDTFNDLNSFKVFNLDVKNYTKDLIEVENCLENECLTTIGIDNVNIYKRERLINAEATQNNEQIALSKNSMYSARRKAMEEINLKYGLNINVDFSIQDEIAEVEKEEV